MSVQKRTWGSLVAHLLVGAAMKRKSDDRLVVARR